MATKNPIEKYQLLIEFTEFRIEQTKELIKRMEPLLKKVIQFEGGDREMTGQAHTLKSNLTMQKHAIEHYENEIRKYREAIDEM